jgi:hypothetical protein
MSYTGTGLHSSYAFYILPYWCQLFSCVNTTPLHMFQTFRHTGGSHSHSRSAEQKKIKEKEDKEKKPKPKV